MTEKIKERMKLSRELVENLLIGNKKKMGKEYFFIFSISKFILLKERIFKKNYNEDSTFLYFNNVVNSKYIPAILMLAEEIKKNGEYIRDDMIVKLENDFDDSEKLKETLWIFNKVRDSFAHMQYDFDIKENAILINNAPKGKKYKLICSIPIELLNSISFFIEEIDMNKESEINLDSYKRYINKIIVKYDVDLEKVIKNDYIFYMKEIFLDNYKLGLNNNNNNNLFNVKKNSNSLNVSKEKLGINLSFNKRTNIEKYKNETLNDKIKVYENSLNIKNDLFFLFDSEIKKELNNLTIRQLYKLIDLLLNYEPTNNKEKKQIQFILKKFRLLIEQRVKLEEEKQFDVKSSEIMREISAILGIKNVGQDSDAIIALYNYMVLVFSQEKDIDYSHMCMCDLNINFDPKKSGQGTGKVYKNIVVNVNKICFEFLNEMQILVNKYKSNPSEKFRHSLITNYAKFYTSIMESLGKKNELIITSLRNSVEHGNFFVNRNGSITLYDLSNQGDINSIKFLCESFMQPLFDITKNIELSNAKEIYTMDNFFKELNEIVDSDVLVGVKDIMNEFSKIIFGKEIIMAKGMEYMYHEAISSIISQHLISK